MIDGFSTLFFRPSYPYSAAELSNKESCPILFSLCDWNLLCALCSCTTVTTKAQGTQGTNGPILGAPFGPLFYGYKVAQSFVYPLLAQSLVTFL